MIKKFVDDDESDKDGVLLVVNEKDLNRLVSIIIVVNEEEMNRLVTSWQPWKPFDQKCKIYEDL